MNVLFLTLVDFKSFQERNIYTDLLREFIKHGHFVYAISPVEKRKKKQHILYKKTIQQFCDCRLEIHKKPMLLKKAFQQLPWNQSLWQG